MAAVLEVVRTGGTWSAAQAGAAFKAPKDKEAMGRDVLQALETLSAVGLLVRFEAAGEARWRAGR